MTSTRTYDPVEPRSVAFLGLGVMGYPMAGHLARAGHRVTVYNRSAAKAAAWTGEYPGADWCERETWEMYGFDFLGHPNLIKLYLPGEFEGFPMRKDFPLLAREVKPWPGLVDVEQFPATYKGDDA